MANTSVWAQPEKDSQALQQFAMQPEPGPSVWAPVGNQPSTPDLSAVSRPQPNVQVFKPSPLQQQIANDQQRLQKVQFEQQNPWGTAQNHPGKLGKLAHVFSEIGNIAGDIFAPSTMALIPGTQLNREVQEGGLAKRLNMEQAEQSENEVRGAQTAKTQEETAEMPGKTQSEETLQGAQTGNLESETEARKNPPQEWKALTGVLGPNGEPVEVEARSGQIRLGSVSGLQQQRQPKPDTPEQQYIDEYQRLHKGATVADAERAYTADTQKAPQSLVLVPGPNGTYQAQNVQPGSKVQPGALSPTQLGGETVAGNKAQQKLADAATDSDETLTEMRQFAAQPSATNDYALLMSFIGLTKPESLGKLRLNNNEISLVTGTRSMLGNMEALESKIANGQMLTPDQRQQMIRTAEVVNGAIHRRATPQQAAGAQTAGGAPPQGADVKVKGADGKMYWGNSKTKQILGEVQ